MDPRRTPSDTSPLAADLGALVKLAEFFAAEGYPVANLRSRAAASVEVFSLLRKPDLVEVEVPIRYLGFDIPPHFIASYGMDYAQRYRHLPYIAVLNS